MSDTTETIPTIGTQAPQRFRRQHRLPDSAAFSRVFEKAKRSRDKMFTVLYKENGSRPARLGLAISKRHCKLAVRRNRLKRAIRESFRHSYTDLHGLDIVVLNRPAAMRASNRGLSDSLQEHWQRCRTARSGGTQ